MPFLQHLGELRKRLTIVVLVLIVGVAVLYFFTDPIMKFMLAPVASSMRIKPIVLGPLDALGVRIQLSLWASVVLTSPITIWQIMAFLLPALKERERRFVVPTFAAMVLLFLGGVALCYLVILQYSFGWLVGQAGTTMTSMLTAQDTITVVQFFLLAFGLAFELPVIIFYLVYFGVVPYRKLRSSWRTAYLIIATAACLVTPDWSPVTMIALAVAMVILYEGTMATCKIVLRHRIREQDETADAALGEA
jgi:sec-independent protein translocase protein TatC